MWAVWGWRISRGSPGVHVRCFWEKMWDLNLPQPTGSEGKMGIELTTINQKRSSCKMDNHYFFFRQFWRKPMGTPRCFFHGGSSQDRHVGIAYTLNLECTRNDQFICGWALSFSVNPLCYYFAQIRPFTDMHRVGSRLSTSIAWGPTLAPRLSPRFGLEALPAFAKDVSSGTKPSLERKVATALTHGPTGSQL